MKKPVVKKETKWKEVFKIGKWTPATVLVEEEVEKLSKDHNPIYKCCLRCNSRNVYRAIETKNPELLTKLMLDCTNIPSLNLGWSSDSIIRKVWPMIVKSGDAALIEAYLAVN